MDGTVFTAFLRDNLYINTSGVKDNKAINTSCFDGIENIAVSPLDETRLYINFRRSKSPVETDWTPKIFYEIRRACRYQGHLLRLEDPVILSIYADDKPLGTVGINLGIVKSDLDFNYDISSMSTYTETVNSWSEDLEEAVDFESRMNSWFAENPDEFSR